MFNLAKVKKTNKHNFQVTKKTWCTLVTADSLRGHENDEISL